ncbi:MAG: aromatic amino acid hydroxylase [Proteobacteria bacterium]|jgi:phenylalanine-4-hydroxylase|nr:aromatic amino acid hydroxylase [Pseudomonadota bacterium]
MESLPVHLKKYIVDQDYGKYTPVDQAVWRYILRQLRAFLRIHAHESYLDGLEKTGITIDTIPKIEEISQKLEKFGWRALPVSGFIPPAAFMELQSLSVLPIASDMRSLDHLLYTPAPDIVHEAAGHAPILINPEFANYLKAYAQVAKKAIISKEDLDVYSAIRDLSDLKEHPDSTAEQIQNAQERLDQVTKAVSHLSEAAQLARMNWWTAEYGLVGSLEEPKIYGAGLLSSVGESRWCLQSKVKKIPMSLDCITTSYDITEPQPQLFVTPSFQKLKEVLHDFSKTMAFKTGGRTGLDKAIKAESVNTVELDSGLQISGVLVNYEVDSKGQVCFLKFQGPTQICKNEIEIPGQSSQYHQHGYSTPLGDYTVQGELTVGNQVQIRYASGIVMEGEVLKASRDLFTLTKCSVFLYKNQVRVLLFDPAWGDYDVCQGTRVVSVYGGPADRKAYGTHEDFVAHRVVRKSYSPEEKALHEAYAHLRSLREKAKSLSLHARKAESSSILKKVEDIVQKALKIKSHDWLIALEGYELIVFLESFGLDLNSSSMRSRLESIVQQQPNLKEQILDGLQLAHEEII